MTLVSLMLLSLAGPVPAGSFGGIDPVAADSSDLPAPSAGVPGADPSAGGYNISIFPGSDAGLDAAASNVTGSTPMMLDFGLKGLATNGSYLKTFDGNTASTTRGYQILRAAHVVAYGITMADAASNFTIAIWGHTGLVTTWNYSGSPSTLAYNVTDGNNTIPAGTYISAQVLSTEVPLANLSLTLFFEYDDTLWQTSHYAGFSHTGAVAPGEYARTYDRTSSQVNGGWPMLRDGTITGASAVAQQSLMPSLGAELTFQVNGLDVATLTYDGISNIANDTTLSVPFSAGDRISVYNSGTTAIWRPVILFEFAWADGTDSTYGGWGKGNADGTGTYLTTQNNRDGDGPYGWALPYAFDLVGFGAGGTPGQISDGVVHLRRNGNSTSLFNISIDADDHNQTTGDLYQGLLAGDRIQAFESDGTPLYFPIAVYELVRSSGVARYWWNFTDGGTQSLVGRSPQYTWANLGNFTITLTVIDGGGQKASTTFWIEVAGNPPPIAAANAGGSDIIIDQGTDAGLDGSASTDDVGITDYWWTFVDGGSQNLSGITPAYTWDNPGNFTVTLEVRDSGGKVTGTTFWITIRTGSAPVADASAGGYNTNISKGSDAGLNGSASTDDIGIVAYWWNFTDSGLVSLTGIAPAYGWSNARNVTITLTVIDTDGYRDVITFWIDVEEVGIPIRADPTAGGYNITIFPGYDAGLDGSASVATGSTPMMLTFGNKGTTTSGTFLDVFGGNVASTSRGYQILRHAEIEAISFTNAVTTSSFELAIWGDSGILATWQYSGGAVDGAYNTFDPKATIPAGTYISVELVATGTSLVDVDVAVFFEYIDLAYQSRNVVGFSNSGNLGAGAYSETYDGTSSGANGGWPMLRDGRITGAAVVAQASNTPAAGASVTFQVGGSDVLTLTFDGISHIANITNANAPFLAGDGISAYNSGATNIARSVMLVEFEWADGADTMYMGWGEGAATGTNRYLVTMNQQPSSGPHGWMIPYELDLVAFGGRGQPGSALDDTFQLRRNGNTTVLYQNSINNGESTQDVGSLFIGLQPGDRLQLFETLGSPMPYPIAAADLALSGGAVQFFWNFTDSGPVSLTGVTPSYLWNNLGNFSVNLTVVDGSGDKSSFIFWISVAGNAPPIADARAGGYDVSISQGGNIGLDGSLSSDDTGIVTYWWNFTDGGNQSLSGIAPAYVWNNPGNFSVAFTVQDEGGKTNTTYFWVNVMIGQPPVADPSAGGYNLTITAGNDVGLNGSASTDDVGVIAYWWNFTDGGPQSLTGMSPAYGWNTANNYTLTLTVVDADGNRDATNFWIRVVASGIRDGPAPVANATAGGYNIIIPVGTDAGLNASNSIADVATPMMIGFGRQGNVPVGGWLDTFNGNAPTDVYGYTIIRNAHIEAIGLTNSDPTSSWTIEILENGFVVGSWYYSGIAVTGADHIFSPQITLTGGSYIAMRLAASGSSMSDITVSLWFEYDDLAFFNSHLAGFSKSGPVAPGEYGRTFNGAESQNSGGWLMLRDGFITGASIMVRESPPAAGDTWTFQIDGVDAYDLTYDGISRVVIDTNAAIPFSAGDRISGYNSGSSIMVRPIVLFEFRWDDGVDSAYYGWGQDTPLGANGYLRGQNGQPSDGTHGWMLPWDFDLVGFGGTSEPASVTNGTFELQRNGGATNIFDIVLENTDRNWTTGELLDLDLGDWMQGYYSAANFQYPMAFFELILDAGPPTFFWNFTDGSAQSLSGVTPAYIWNNPGNFTVTLTIMNAYGQTNSVDFWINVGNVIVPTADPSAGGHDIAIEVNSDAGLNGSASYDDVGITDYWWNFTDGGPQSLTGISPAYTWTTPGTYSITLTVRDTDGFFGSTVFWIQVDPYIPPVADPRNGGYNVSFITGNDAGLDGSASYDDKGIVTYWWNFTDSGSKSLTGITPAYSWTIPGVFIVTLTVMDTDGVSDSFSFWVQVYSLFPPIADPTAGGFNISIYTGIDAALDGSASTDNIGIVAYWWNFTDGTPKNLFGAAPIYTWINEGNVTITLTVMDTDGYTASATFWIEVGVIIYDVFQIQVVPEWNFISYAADVSGPATSVLDDSAGDGLTRWSRAYHWGATGWTSYDPARPAYMDDLVDIDTFSALWIFVIALGDGLITVNGSALLVNSVDLEPGWNFVGFPSRDYTMSRDLAMVGIPTSEIWGFAFDSDYWMRLILSEDPMRPGYGWWIFTTTAATWSLPP